MPEKWDKKAVLKYAKELRSPFENLPKPGLAQLGDKVREVFKKKV